MTVQIKWLDSGREPQCKPDPAYPHGKDIDETGDQGWGCKTELPYPAPRCGAWLLICDNCGVRVAVTAAGRPDDPRSVRLPCKVKESEH